MESSEKISPTRSQTWIMNALLELMEIKPFQKIKINEISAKADLDRRTFYRYFKSKEDVLELYCRILLEKLADKILERDFLTENAIAQKGLSIETVAIAYFEFWSEHMDFLRLLEKSRMLYFFSENHDTLMFYHVSLKVKQWLSEEEIDKETRYHFFYHMGGALHMTIRWMSENSGETPEEMAKMVTNLFQSNQ